MRKDALQYTGETRMAIERIADLSDQLNRTGFFEPLAKLDQLRLIDTRANNTPGLR